MAFEKLRPQSLQANGAALPPGAETCSPPVSMVAVTAVPGRLRLPLPRLLPTPGHERRKSRYALGADSRTGFTHALISGGTLATSSPYTLQLFVFGAGQRPCALSFCADALGLIGRRRAPAAAALTCTQLSPLSTYEIPRSKVVIASNQRPVRDFTRLRNKKGHALKLAGL